MLGKGSVKWLSLFVVLALFLVACTAGAGEERSADAGSPALEEEQTASSATAEVVVVEQESTATAVPDMDDEAAGEAVAPAVVVEDQELGADGTVMVPAVTAAEAGWVVIHTQQDGGPGPVIGQTAVPAGESNEVRVEIDPEAATETLYAMLHVDAGTEGTYEFPGDDVPATDAGGNVVVLPFQVSGLSAADTGDQTTAGAMVATNTSDQLGSYLTDGAGLSLYLFQGDEPGSGTSTCYDDCANAWPPLLTDGEPQVSGDVDAALLDTIEREDGSLQVTYNGWPLYYFVRDEGPGDTAGQGVDGFGALWYLVTPAGDAVQAMADDMDSTPEAAEMEEEEEIDY